MYDMKAIASLVVLVSLWTITHSMPIAKQMVDLSHPFDNETLYFPAYSPFELERKTLPQLLDDDRYLVQYEEFVIGTHLGTHIDAPIHFVKNSWTLDDIPLHRLLNVQAAVVDITDKAELNHDYGVTIDDLLHWENETGHRLDHMVVLMRSGWGKKWSNRESYTGTPELDTGKLHFPGFSEEAAQWLVSHRDIYGVGVDTLSFDPGNSRDFPAHRILLGASIYGIENIGDMDELPIYGATLYMLPMKIAGASGAATRIVATFPKVMFKNH